MINILCLGGVKHKNIISYNDRSELNYRRYFPSYSYSNTLTTSLECYDLKHFYFPLAQYSRDYDDNRELTIFIYIHESLPDDIVIEYISKHIDCIIQNTYYEERPRFCPEQVNWKVIRKVNKLQLKKELFKI